jgi:hypothetical protein
MAILQNLYGRLSPSRKKLTVGRSKPPRPTVSSKRQRQNTRWAVETEAENPLETLSSRIAAEVRSEPTRHFLDERLDKQRGVEGGIKDRMGAKLATPSEYKPNLRSNNILQHEAS